MPLFVEGEDPRDTPVAQSGPHPRAPDPLQITPPPSMAVDPATQGPVGLLGAGLQQTPLGAAYVAMTRGAGSQTRQPGYTAFEDPQVKGTPEELSLQDELIGSRNPTETASIIARAHYEEQQRRSLAVSPGGTAVSLITGLADPTLYIPFAGEARAAAMGVRMARDAATFAAQSAASQTITNAFRAAPVPFSKEDVATAALFGGFVGAGLSFLEPAEKLRGEAALADVRREMTTGEVAPPQADPSVFTGTLHALHTSENENLTGFEPNFAGERYEGDGGTFGPNGVYLDNVGTWTGGKFNGFGVQNIYQTAAKFNKAFVFSPETWKSLLDILPSGAGETSPSQIVDLLRSKGYDGLIVKGFGEKHLEHEAYGEIESALQARGVDPTYLTQDQTFAFKPNNVSVSGKVPRRLGDQELWRASQELRDKMSSSPDAREEYYSALDKYHKTIPSIEDWLNKSGARIEMEPAEPATVPSEATADAHLSSLSAQPVGAAASDPRDMRLSPFTPEAFRNAVSQIPGGQRVLAAGATAVTRASPTARVFLNGTRAGARAMGDLAETALKFTQAKLGITASSPGTVPVDRLVRMQKFRLETQTRDILSGAFKQYLGNPEGKLWRQRAYVDSLTGNAGDRMSFDEFKKQVYLAGANGGEHAVPEVAAAAREVDQKVFKPVERLAQETKGPDGKPMLGDTLSPPAGDKGFVPRIWNKLSIARNPNEFDRIVEDWLWAQQTEKAATKDRLTALQDQHEKLGGVADKLDGRLKTMQERAKATATRADEVGQSVRRGDKRADVLADRAGEIQSAISELQEFRDAMAGEAHGPETAARIADLDEQIAALRKEAAPVSKSEIDRLEKAEVKEIFAGGPVRHGAQVALGLREFPDKPSALQYFRENGGINDTNGDAAHTLGRGYTKNAKLRGIVKEAQPGMLGGNAGVRSLDQWGEKLAQDFPEAFPNGRASPDEVIDLLRDAAAGNEPDWFARGRESEDLTAAREHADMLSQTLEDIHESTGSRPSNLREFAAAIKEANGAPSAVLQRQRDNIEALIEQGRIKGARAGVQAAREEALGLMNRALKGREAKEKGLARATGAAGERDVEQTAVKGRIKLLADRQARQDMMLDVLEQARGNAEQARTDLRSKMEDELRAWKGDASADAIAALKARGEAERVRALKQQAGVYEGKGGRLTSADGPVDRAVKSILESDRDLSRDEILDRAREIRNRINTTADGRLPYDIASGGPAVGYPPTRQQVRGSLNLRDFAIPTHLVSDFVHTDMEHVVPAYLRTLLPDLHLTQRFGDAEMTEQFKKVNEEYDQLKAAAGDDPKKQVALDARRQAETRDLAATRDRIRGTYGLPTTPFQQNLGRVARAVGNWNVGSMLGTSVFNRFQDMANATARRGLMGYMQDGFIPYFKALSGVSDLSKAQLQAVKDMQIGIDTQLGHLSSQFADVTDNHLPGNRFERALKANASLQMALTLHGPWTDMNKQIAASAAMGDFLRTAGRMEAGKATADDLRRMAHAGINPEMAGRISRAFEDGGHTVVEGEKVPNVADWKDRAAADIFQAAIQRDADIAVITPGAEKPLFLSDPLGSMLGQFKGFAFAAQERILLSNLQEMDGRTLQGFFHMMAMGLLSYKAYTLVSGQPTSERPQDWIKEAVIRSGMAGWMGDLNSAQAKLFGGRTDAFRVIGADRMLTRRQTESALTEMLGPTYAHVEAIAGGINDVSHGVWTALDSHRWRQQLQMQNHFLLRQLLDKAEDGFNQSQGITPMNRNPTSYRQ